MTVIIRILIFIFSRDFVISTLCLVMRHECVFSYIDSFNYLPALLLSVTSKKINSYYISCIILCTTENACTFIIKIILHCQLFCFREELFLRTVSFRKTMFVYSRLPNTLCRNKKKMYTNTTETSSTCANS